MKTLITSSYATNASSNFSPNWQRDHDYFVSAATQPTIYQAFVTTFARMWTDTTNFGPMVPTPPRAPALVAPASGAGGVSVTGKFAWKRASWAVSYDVYLGTSPSALTRVANVPAQLVQNPPSTYSWTPSPSLQPNTTYYWKVVSRTNATVVNPSLVAASSTLSFSTAGSSGGGGNLVQQPGFEGYAPPSLGLPGWVSDQPLRAVPAKSETHQPHTGAKNGVCWATTNADCGMYKDVTAPATAQYTLVFYSTADRTGGLDRRERQRSQYGRRDGLRLGFRPLSTVRDALPSECRRGYSRLDVLAADAWIRGHRRRFVDDSVGRRRREIGVHVGRLEPIANPFGPNVLPMCSE